jgi:hypothetical protein
MAVEHILMFLRLCVQIKESIVNKFWLLHPIVSRDCSLKSSHYMIERIPLRSAARFLICKVLMVNSKQQLCMNAIFYGAE